jgi:hypothetical protein
MGSEKESKKKSKNGEDAIQSRSNSRTTKTRHVELRKCFWCGVVGHLQSKCPQPEPALLAAAQGSDVDEEDDLEYILMMTNDMPIEAVFEPNEVILDDGAGKALFHNRSLLHNIVRSTRPMIIGGVDADASPIRVSEQGTFRDLGIVRLSERSSANLLSQSYLIDRGFSVTLDSKSDIFTVKGGINTYEFVRKIRQDGRCALSIPAYFQ